VCMRSHLPLIWPDALLNTSKGYVCWVSELEGASLLEVIILAICKTDFKATKCETFVKRK